MAVATYMSNITNRLPNNTRPDRAHAIGTGHLTNMLKIREKNLIRLQALKTRPKLPAIARAAYCDFKRTEKRVWLAFVYATFILPYYIDSSRLPTDRVILILWITADISATSLLRYIVFIEWLIVDRLYRDEPAVRSLAGAKNYDANILRFYIDREWTVTCDIIPNQQHIV